MLFLQKPTFVHNNVDIGRKYWIELIKQYGTYLFYYNNGDFLLGTSRGSKCQHFFINYDRKSFQNKF